MEMWCKRMQILQKQRKPRQQLHRLSIATARLRKAILQDFHNSMHRFLYLLQQRQTHSCLPASAIGSEKAFQEQKGKGKNFEKGGKPEFAKGGKPEFAKGGKDDKGGKNTAKGEFKGEFKGEKGEKGKQGSKGPAQPVPKASGSKCARISEEPAEVVEANSNKMHDNGAMTDGSKRRHEAVESASDGESASSVIGSFSFISDTGDSPPLFPAVPFRTSRNPQVG